MTVRLAERFSSWPLRADRRLVLATDAPVGVLAERCAAWLDEDGCGAA